MDWREVYQLPLRSDSGSYVWSNNGTMTFTFDFDYDYGEKRKMIKKIVEKLNGDYFAVVGFPCCYVNKILNKLGIFPKN